jgi:hypothetical protein
MTSAKDSAIHQQIPLHWKLLQGLRMNEDDKPMSLNVYVATSSMLVSS